MKYIEKRYDELKVGDVIWWYGAKERIVEVIEYPPVTNEVYQNEKVIRFTVEPADDEAVKILGKFYSHGTYGGGGCLTATVLER